MHWRGIAGLCLLLAGHAIYAQSPPNFNFTDTSGRAHTSAEWTGKRAIVLFFVSTDCPLSNNYVPEFNRIEQTYAPRGIAFYAVQGDATIAVDAVRSHA